MKKIVFATNNANKLAEVQKLLGDKFNLVSLKDIGFEGDIPETQQTIEGNATQKSRYIFDRFNTPVFADDTGLEVAALNGEPGVYSARYAGEPSSASANCEKVLAKLQGIENREARFKTVISYLDEDGTETQLIGIVTGEILKEYQGRDGFGYDPLFRPKGYEISFAEMSMQEKNAISHRGIAVRKLVDHLKKRS